ncbi:MAG: hypothetical protein M3N18_11870 [Actinomycetota bacterium]|nr:hypothetical protein [Actinomycetota bacterium]
MWDKRQEEEYQAVRARNERVRKGVEGLRKMLGVHPDQHRRDFSELLEEGMRRKYGQGEDGEGGER